MMLHQKSGLVGLALLVLLAGWWHVHASLRPHHSCKKARASMSMPLTPRVDLQRFDTEASVGWDVSIYKEPLKGSSQVW